jgi:hypothetical protein
LELLELRNIDFHNVWSSWSSETLIFITFEAPGALKP